MNGGIVLFTMGLNIVFSFVRWCVALSVNDDLLFGVFSVNDIPCNLNENNRNIHDIYNMCLCLGPVTGIFHTVSRIAGAEPEPARRCWRRPASRPVLSWYCIFFGVLPFTKVNPLYLQCVYVWASNWYIPYSVPYCRNRAGTSPTPLASACFPSGSVSVLYFLWSVTFY